MIFLTRFTSSHITAPPRLKTESGNSVMFDLFNIFPGTRLSSLVYCFLGVTDDQPAPFRRDGRSIQPNGHLLLLLRVTAGFSH
jgi:hypothetical protein